MHIPVLINEVLDCLKDLGDGAKVLDCTFGAGGYSKGLLSCDWVSLVHGIDRDPSVQIFADALGDKYPDRFQFTNDTFANYISNTEETYDFIVADIGVSSMQIDNGDRGFSFQEDATLDMRMSPDTKVSAYEVINTFNQKQIADIIYHFGDETRAFKIAKRVIAERKGGGLQTTKQLADLVWKCYGAAAGKTKIHPATKTFQALRIFVNRELEELETLLQKVIPRLNIGGVFAIVSFHALEDRLVKNFIKVNTDRGSVNKYQKFSQNDSEVVNYPLEIVGKELIIPTPEEIKANPRSRSAKLRLARKK